jgi:hypothetical protein
MLKNHKLVAFAVATAVALGGFAGIALANPSFFGTGVTTNSVASSTPQYMTPGLATSTTPVYDAYAPTTSTIKTKTDVAGLLVQLTSSTTPPTLTMTVEYSQDNIDWYRSNTISADTVGTTTRVMNIAQANSYTATFASTTLQQIAPTSANSQRETFAFTIPTPFRYTRVVSSITGAAANVWVQLVPVKQNQ